MLKQSHLLSVLGPLTLGGISDSVLAVDGVALPAAAAAAPLKLSLGPATPSPSFCSPASAHIPQLPEQHF
jgi:hypothetical protein